VLEPSEGRLKWDVALGPIGPSCSNVIQFGKKEDGDGYKFMCMPNNEHETEEKECHVISAGGNDNWKFETALTDKLPHCTTHTFDCTLPNGGQPKRKPIRENIRFYDYCLAGASYNETNGRKYLSYVDMLHVAGIVQTPPAYFKIDVEGFEYDIFTSMIATSPKQLLPSQIQVELHWATRMTGLSWMPRTRSSGELALFAGMMFNGGGYVPVHLDFNPYCTPCMEVLFVQGVC
jgi:Methyltransferase domain